MEPGQSPGGALVDGVIQGANGCVLLVSPGQPRVALLFEDPYSATFAPLKVFDAEGKVVAEDGQHVWLGIEGSKTTSNPACGTTKAFWVFSLSTTDPVVDGL
jgi:hypothetical protein